MREWWYGVDRAEKFGKKVRRPFSVFDPKCHSYYFSTSWKLASASLDPTFVVTTFARYFLAVCPVQTQFSIQSSLHVARYLTMATLSLYLFNLLPLPHLDGTELLSSILDSLFEKNQEPFVYDLEALEIEDTPETTRVRRRWKQRLSKLISIMTMGLFICCILLGGMNTLF